MSDRIEIPVVEGDSWKCVVELRDAAGDPFPFTGLTAHMTLRRDLNSPAFATLSSAPGGGLELDSPGAGDIYVTVPSNVTAGLCRRKQAVRIDTELELRDGSDPPDVQSYAKLTYVVTPESTSVSA